MQLLLGLRDNPLFYLAVVLAFAWFFQALVFGRFSGRAPNQAAPSRTPTSTGFGLADYARTDQPEAGDPPPFS